MPISASPSAPAVMPVITNPVHEGLINGNVECQRRALLNFFATNRNQVEGDPIDHTDRNTAVLGKLDALLNPSNTFNASYNFDYSKNTNQTFDVPPTAIRRMASRPSKINVANFNLFTTISQNKLNELHVTYAKELRPRNISSNVPTTRPAWGIPHFASAVAFLQPNVDELLWRTQIKNNLSIVSGNHTFKAGGEWLHTLNDQVFRGFFTGRYLFSTVSGFMRYASSAGPGGLAPCGGLLERRVGHPPDALSGRQLTGWHASAVVHSGVREPASPMSIRPASRRSATRTWRFSLQDQWIVRPNVTVNYGLRWDAQLMPETIDPATTAYAQFVNDPAFLSDGTIPDQTTQFQPRLGIAWDVKSNQRTVIRANFGQCCAYPTC